ncbi:MAG: aspartate carbamoyltransferase catalytic subunit [Gammaproteobacteria bacterium]|nr:aspartate carbamoyltransferase catalytic subunit [Gammaproteobacteria bacterium]
MKHLLSSQDLTKETIHTLIQRAQQFKQGATPPSFAHIDAASLFYEHSTRTLLSFQLAANRLNLTFSPLHIAQSSVQKGETLLDSLQTLHAMGIQLFIIRHPTSHIFDSLLPELPTGLHLINAGDGQHEHPSQALLDLMTIAEHYPTRPLQSLRIAIVGDIRHSRVANSFQACCALLGIHQLTFISPSAWAPQQLACGSTSDQLATGIEGADVIMTLRVQQERLEPQEQRCLTTYHEHYGLTAAALAHANPAAIVLHPGPINRGIEISSDVADGPQSLILKQVENGVWMRMAIIERVLQAIGPKISEPRP